MRRDRRTGFGITDVLLGESSESEVKSLVDVPNVLLEMFSDLWEFTTVRTGHQDPVKTVRHNFWQKSDYICSFDV